MVLIPLFSKEFRQNLIIYLVPYFCLLLFYFLRISQTNLIANNWINILVLTIPIALAGAYGLQAFDMEEDGQTRDFLLTKPLSVKQIINAKFIIGLTVLIPITCLWILVLSPSRITWPDPTDFHNLWFLSFLLFTSIIYLCSFTCGVLIKGPQKLIAALLSSALVLIWFAFGWYQYLAIIFLDLDLTLVGIPLAILLVTAISITYLALFIRSALGITELFLKNVSLLKAPPELRRYFLGVILIPLCLFAINFLSKPVIRPFNSLFSTFFNAEDWFSGIDGAYDPNGKQYAFTDSQGRLALAKPGGKPRVIYKGELAKGNQLSRLNWSPDGRLLAFSENNRVKLIRLADRKIFPIYQGDQAFWSANSTELVIAGQVVKSPPQPGTPDSGINSYRLSRVNLTKGIIYNYNNNLSFPGKTMVWNSNHHQVIALTNYWSLLIMNLGNGQIDLEPLPLPTKTAATIFFARIFPLNKNESLYRLIIFSNAKATNRSKVAYNITVYDCDLDQRKIVLVKTFLNSSYKDVLPGMNGPAELLVSSKAGVYRTLKLTGTVVK